mgnify:CR=1 FL=1|jgi:hypothetical protein
MKNRHNKKRNTAFIFESLMREAAAAIIKADEDRKNTVLKIVKKHFKPDTGLKKHLECYKSLYENQDISIELSEKILKEAKMASRLIDPHGLFKQQTELINDINKDLSPSFFNNFVPNYKTLASIDQIFSDKLTPKSRVMLETALVEDMTRPAPKDDTDSVDSIVLRTFTDKFNEKYATTLSEEQKHLLSYYITSFADNSVELKMFLNEELARLKSTLTVASSEEVFKEDSDMKQKATKIIEKLDKFRQTEIDEEVLLTVLKTQELVKELTNGSNN